MSEFANIVILVGVLTSAVIAGIVIAFINMVHNLIYYICTLIYKSEELYKNTKLDKYAVYGFTAFMYFICLLILIGILVAIYYKLAIHILW